MKNASTLSSELPELSSVNPNDLLSNPEQLLIIGSSADAVDDQQLLVVDVENMDDSNQMTFGSFFKGLQDAPSCSDN
jgi:hypothetical protein